MTAAPVVRDPGTAPRWVSVCSLKDILPGGGVCALVGGRQVAVFRVAGRVFALSNQDPFTRANVLSRGLTGSYTARDTAGNTAEDTAEMTAAPRERYKVASPLLKHAFDLETGACLSDPAVSVATYAVRVDGEQVWIGDEWTGLTD